MFLNAFCNNSSTVLIAGELGEDISDIDWKDVLRRRNGISTRLALLKALKDLRADIVAEIRLKNSK